MSQHSQRSTVLVFRSNIPDEQTGELVIAHLKRVEGVSDANLDLDDWEKIVRVECSTNVLGCQVESIVAQLGYQCSELND